MSETHWTDLRAALTHCATRVPLYRGVAAPAGAGDVEVACRAALEGFPILTKDRLRGAFPHKLVPEGVVLAEALKQKQVEFVGTSGTTGERVQVLWHQPWWDAQERDGFRLNRLTRACVEQPGYCEAVLTTPVCSGNLCHVGKLPMAERELDEGILFLNQTVDPSLWTDEDVNRIADELEEFEPVAIEADPAYLAFFLVRLRKLGRRPYQPKFIDLSYEFPSRLHVRTIAREFSVPVLDAYGSTECGFVFMECESGRLHHNAAWSHVEVVPVKGLDGAGVLLVTPLRSSWLNLVRFDTGDLVRPSKEPCPCGLADGLVLEGIEGRAKDCLIHADGRLVTVRTVDRALAKVSGLLHYRLVQRSAKDFDLDLIADELEPLDADAAASALEPVLGARPSARVVTSLPVEASGKFRLCRATHVDAEKVVKEAS